MTELEIIRAWKDEDYLSNLSEEQRALLPDNPAGFTELSFADLNDAGGLLITATMLPVTAALCETIGLSNVTVCKFA